VRLDNEQFFNVKISRRICLQELQEKLHQRGNDFRMVVQLNRNDSKMIFWRISTMSEKSPSSESRIAPSVRFFFDDC